MDSPTFDLHSALAAMADYPVMLRRLGVVRVVEVDLAGTGIDPAGGTVTVSATPSWPVQIPQNPDEPPGANVRVVPVGVPVHLSPNRFALRAEGVLDAAAEGFGLAEIDVDQAASQLLGLARQLVEALAPGAAATATRLPERLSLPSLRNAGFSVTQADRASRTRDRLQAAAKFFSLTEEATLDDPDHAVKGFVVDVWDDRTTSWHTLCARRGTYRLPGGRSFTADDEGAVSSAATAKADAGAGTMMYLHESMARWHGWSMVAPPVGRPVLTEEEGSRPDTPAGPALPGFEVSFVPVPGSLPVLRFGRGYRFRLRAVDVVGQADPLVPTAGFGGAFPPADEPPARHLRFDPVLAPVVVPTAPMTEGESVDTLVIRPEPGSSGVVSDLLAPLLATEPARHLVPPKVSVALVEEHGMVDTEGRPDPRKYPVLANRDRADLTGVGTPDPRQPHQRYVPGSDLPVTWLPDPISRGAVVTGLPGGPAKASFYPLLAGWPDARSVRLRLADGPAGWSSGGSTLTLRVPRGETRTVQLSSFLGPDDVDLLGHVAWLTESPSAAAAVAAARADVEDGQAWQMTPPRTLTLVNAVRTPTVAPSLVAIGNDASRPRTPGSTAHSLVGDVTVSRPSTGLISLVATVTETVDDPAAPGPATVTTVTRPPLRENTTTGGEAAPGLPVDYDPDPVTANQISFAATHVLGDTRRHTVSYAVEGTTRYLEHFVQRGQVTFTGTDSLPLSAGIVPGTAAVRSLDGSVAYREDEDFTVDTQEGTIARTKPDSGIPTDTPVEVALVAPPATSTGNAKELDLPSTARPAAPKVAWIVPTFGWTTQSTLLSQTRTRSGGGLRVFLDRPWFSSGTGEQLAVVLATAPVAADDHQLRELVTQLGTDPIVRTEALTSGFPATGQFPLAKATRSDLTVPELPAGRFVAAAIHDVEWDAERQRWACDIVLPPDRVDTPFVHLALARYQPHSLAGVELSAVAPLEWAQLAPDRVATVRRDLTKVTVTVTGRAHTGTDAKAGPNTVSAILQTTSALNPGDLDWTTVGPADGKVLTAVGQPDGTTTWTGVVTLPGLPIVDRYRLVITEQERLTGGSRLTYSDAIRV